MNKIFLTLLFLLPYFLNAQLSEQQFENIRKELTPDKNEAWKSIPWKLSVLEAQKLAVENQKPIFIWAMDGHPLTCV